MTTPSIDDGNYDVQFSIRVPKSLADEINARAEREGIKPSAWIRNAISRTIENKDQAVAEDIRVPLMRILQQDEAVRSIIREITQTEKAPVRSAEEIQRGLDNAIREREHIYMKINETDHHRQELRTRRVHLKKRFADTSAAQKKALSDFMQNPEDRAYIQELDKLTVELNNLKEELNVSSLHYEETAKERDQLRDKLTYSEARVFQFQEEMRSLHNKGQFNENLRRINQRKKREEDMK